MKKIRKIGYAELKVRQIGYAELKVRGRKRGLRGMKKKE